MRHWPLLIAISLVSAVGIAYQVALMRVFTIGQWHHFAYMVISIAMLGFGASGSLLALLRDRVAGRETLVFGVSTFSLSIGITACYEISQRIPFETPQLAAVQSQWLYLLILYALLSVPFFFASTCLVCGFFIAPKSVGLIYAVNMLGSGAGAVAVVWLLHGLSPDRVPGALALVAALAHALAFFPLKGLGTANKTIGVLAWSLLPGMLQLAWLLGGGHAPIRVSEYKALSYAMQFPDAEVLAERHGPLSSITAVASRLIRETPGQISNYPMETLGPLPEQIALFFDAGAISPINRFEADLGRMAYLDYVTGAVAYRVVPENPTVFVAGAGGGSELWSALWHGARRVTAAEVDENVIELMRGPFREFSGGLYNRPEVEIVAAEARGYLESHTESFDLIVAPLQGTFAASVAGAYALNETYLYTVDALTLYLNRLTDRGALAMTCWVESPARTSLKLFATAVEACHRAGIRDPGRNLVFIRSWNTATIVVGRSPLTDAQVRSARQFCEQRWFDLCYVPGMRAEDANRFIILERPEHFEFADRLLRSDIRAASAQSLFYLNPATDDRPYFFLFVRWSGLPSLFRQFGLRWMPAVEWGYVTLVATLVQGCVLAALLILLPVGAFARRPGLRGARSRVVAYFGVLGCAYMFLEIACIQRFTLYLAHPVYAVTVTLATFLVFGGLGSLAAHRASTRSRLWARYAVVGIACAGISYVGVLGAVFSLTAGWGFSEKAALSVVMLSPLAFCMGIPFPIGMQRVSDACPELVPWAWAVNGSLSVLGALLAAVVAVHFGIRSVMLAAALAYLTILPLLRNFPIATHR